MDLTYKDSQEEAERLLKALSQTLPERLGTLLGRPPIGTNDILNLLKYLKDNYKQLQAIGVRGFDFNDVCHAHHIRNKLYHQEGLALDRLRQGVEGLHRIMNTFKIQTPYVPLRVLRCRLCKAIVTRTAQPTVMKTDMSGIIHRVARCYDVQVYSVANRTGEVASIDNTWYDGYVWTYQYCAKCLTDSGRLTLLGFRFDWAPADRINHATSKIVYDRTRQAMVLESDGGMKVDLTHLVSDGQIRRHRYAFYERSLEEIDPTKD